MSAIPAAAQPSRELIGARSLRHPLARALRLGVPDLTTTVLTMTLTGLAADSRVAGGSGEGSLRRIAAVLAMLCGALAGALLLEISLIPPLLAAATLALVAALMYVPVERRAT